MKKTQKGVRTFSSLNLRERDKWVTVTQAHIYSFINLFAVISSANQKEKEIDEKEKKIEGSEIKGKLRQKGNKVNRGRTGSKAMEILPRTKNPSPTFLNQNLKIQNLKQVAMVSVDPLED